MKRFAAILLTGVLCIAWGVPSFAAIETNAAFWAVSSMEFAYHEGLLTDAELQKANSPMSRKEFCKMVMRFLRIVTEREWQPPQKSPFADCNDPDVLTAYEAGIISGKESGKFDPDSTLTREQMAIMIGRTLKTCGIDLTEKAVKSPFRDTKTLYASSNQYIDQLYGVGIISGYDDGSYGPFRKMTVQEAVVSFVKAYRFALEERAKEVPEEPEVKEPEVKEPETKPEEPETKPQEPEIKEGEETAELAGKEITLNWTAEELEDVWGEPDRIDYSVYDLDRYIYINDYENYFFVTFQDDRVAEIFVPGTGFSYLNMDGNGTTADIKNLDYFSSVEHSGVIYNEDSEARILLDYKGRICGLLLQTKTFIEETEPMSTLLNAEKESLEAQLLDLIQARRVENGLPLLSWDKKLWDAARFHAEDMASNEYYAYADLRGKTPFERIMERGKTFLTASETIARQRGDVVHIYQDWMRSVAKYSNLMDQTMQEVGVGASSRTKVLYVTVDLCGQGEED